MKRFTAILTAFLMLALMVCAGTTALAADKVFVDEMNMDFPHILDRSDGTACEFNGDLETGAYDKIDTIKTTEWFTWKIDGDVTGFDLLIQCVNGLGNPEEVKFEVSKDNKTWVEVPHNYTKLDFDGEIYINYDKAYFLFSHLTNKGTIPAGCRYLRISLLPYMKDGSVPYNILLDKLEVSYKPGSAPVETPSEEKPIAPAEPSSEAPAEESTEAPVEESTEAPVEESTEAPVEESTEAPAEESTNAEKPAEKANLTWLWIVLAVVVAGGIAVVVVLLVKGGKKPTDAE